MTLTSRLRSDNVSLRYPASDEKVVFDTSLLVADGAITTIIGPNGCGKSTLLRALGRLLRPVEGSVVLDGEVIQRYPAKEVARRLGLLGQQPQAPHGITVEDLVHRGRYPHLGFFTAPAAHDDVIVESAMALAGVDELRDREVDTLSGGQRQRAWIAMSLAQDTDLLLLDEPTTYLDMAHQLEVMELVGELHEQGKTILLVLHDLNQAASVSDRIVAMQHGRIVRSGEPSDVIDPDLLQALYEVECDVFPNPATGQPVCIPYGKQGIPFAEPNKPSVVRAQSLSTGYGGQSVVSRQIDVSLPHGAITTLIGPNGCGKSTLLRTAARLLKPLGGSVLVDGIDPHSIGRKALSRQLGMVIQAADPPNGFVVEDVVAAGRIAHQTRFKRWTPEDAAAVSRAIDTCGLAELRFREFDTLSGGQRQRTWVAMTLAQDTPVMFLDEPTTFLDIGYQTEVLDLVYRLNREEGRTVVMVLHDLNMAARYSDYLLVMDEGEIVAFGPPREVVTEKLAVEVFDTESRVIEDSRTGRPLVLPVRAVKREVLGDPAEQMLVSG